MGGLQKEDTGFLCDSLQLSLGWDRRGRGEAFLGESERDPLLLSLSEYQGPGDLSQSWVFAAGN